MFAAVLAFIPARLLASVSFDFFYDNLSPYGDWVEVGDYGTCWRPADVDPDWSPYTDGYWAYTDAGWTWVSYEDYGGIVYHYGRWTRVDDVGWCWVPDYEWAPAWVSWRSSDDYVGWAPLPPEARWRRGVGISIWADNVYDIGPGYYSFCRVNDFGAPVLRQVIVNRGENFTIISHTVNVTNITYNNNYGGGGVIFNGGPSFATISARASRPVPTLKLVQNVNINPADWAHRKGGKGGPSFGAKTIGNQLVVAAPQVSPPSDPAALRSHAKQVFTGNKISKGWGGMKNPEQMQQLRQEMQRQTKGITPETAPAKPVAANDLKVVPTKADPNAAPPAIHEKSGKDRRPDGVATQPANIPPVTPENPALKPFRPVLKPGPQNPPAANVPPAVDARALEQERIAKDRQAESAAQQKQIATQQDAKKAQMEELRRRQLEAQPPIVPPQGKPNPADLRKAQNPEREREKLEPQRGGQFPPVPATRGNVPPPGAPQPSPGHSKESKDSKDKNKDKNNGN